jgi:uncharacterized membrane protein YdjX (TVP38/TMEM64 family)
MAQPARRSSIASWLRNTGIALAVVAFAYVVLVIWDREALVRWMNEASPLWFFLAMAVLPAIGVPLSLFLIVAGATFGVWGALIGSLVAITICHCIGYALAHSKLRPALVRLFDRLGYEVPDFTAGGAKAWRFAATIKLTPALPTFAKMYVLALTAVPFPIYLTVSLVVTGAFAIAFIVLGDSLFAHDGSEITVAAIAVVVLAAVAVVWWKRRRDVSADAALSAA